MSKTIRNARFTHDVDEIFDSWLEKQTLTLGYSCACNMYHLAHTFRIKYYVIVLLLLLTI